jgi:hypothetical protein
MSDLTNLINDAVKLVKGFGSLIGYLFSRDDILVSISLFSSNQISGRAGESFHFEVIIANNSSQDRPLRIMIDFYLKENQTHPEGHHAYFVKNIVTHSRKNNSMQFSYDWNYSASFTIDGKKAEPDTSWCGECRTEGKYVVSAVLLNEKDESLEQLTLVQEVHK